MSRRKVVDESLAPPVSLVRPLMRRWIWQLAGLLIVVGLVLVGAIWLGSFARDQIRDRERFLVSITDIECTPPLATERTDFLEEVLYHGNMPERFSTLDNDLTQRLTECFERHPWVAKVDKVEIVPPRTVRVNLTYRQPVLAVVVTPDLAEPTLGDGADWPLRAVDDQGVLLPKKATTTGLPVFHHAPRPVGGAGQGWGDYCVLAAAETAAFLGPLLAKLGFTNMTWSEEGLVFWGKKAKVIWGRTPPLDIKKEATPALKEKRLVEIYDDLHPISRWLPLMRQFDLRPLKGVEHRLVPREQL